jgi:hypothetical protein
MLISSPNERHIPMKAQCFSSFIFSNRLFIWWTKKSNFSTLLKAVLYCFLAILVLQRAVANFTPTFSSNSSSGEHFAIPLTGLPAYSLIAVTVLLSLSII